MKTNKPRLSRCHYLWISSIVLLCTMSVVPSFHPPEKADFILHLLGYCLLALFPLVCFRRRDFAFMAAAAAPTLGLWLEYVQDHIEGRNFSAEDMLANNIGAGIGIVVGLVLRLIRKSQKLQEESHE